MRGERGQVTIFVVIGLVLLFTIGLFYTIISISSRPPPDEGNGDTAIISSTIASCVDSVVAAELKTLGRAGGLVSFEGWPHGIVDDGIKQRIVLFGITKNADDLLPTTYPAPAYPEEGVSFRTMTQDIRTGRELVWFQDGYFGDVNFPAICEMEGPNNPTGNLACKYYPGNPPNSYGPSVQKLLEQRITQQVQACASPTSFSKAIGKDVQKVGNPQTEVTFTRTNTIVTLTYPLEVQGDETETRFQRSYDVRFLPVMQFAIELARADTRNATFNVETDLDDLPSYRPGFSVLRATVTPTGVVGEASGEADLITIVDAESVLDGSSFIFSFLAEHRPPMLDQITNAQWRATIVDGERLVATGADPDDGPVSINTCLYRENCPVPRVEVVDEDGEKDWQTYIWY